MFWLGNHRKINLLGILCLVDTEKKTKNGHTEQAPWYNEFWFPIFAWQFSSLHRLANKWLMFVASIPIGHLWSFWIWLPVIFTYSYIWRSGLGLRALMTTKNFKMVWLVKITGSGILWRRDFQIGASLCFMVDMFKK